MKKDKIEYRWEAYHIDEKGKMHVFRRGPAREDLSKVAKAIKELQAEISDLNNNNVPQNAKRFLAPYWRFAKIRVIKRTITPWNVVIDHDEIDEMVEVNA